MDGKKSAILLLALGHLGLVGLGAAGFSFWKVGQALETYGIFTGTNRTFDFFAPGVGPGYRAEFDVYGPAGRFEHAEALQPKKSRESELRSAGIVEVFTREREDPAIRKAMSASWAGKVFFRNPRASQIRLRVEEQDVPTMKEYREGKRYGWEPLYEAKFERRKGGGAD